MCLDKTAVTTLNVYDRCMAKGLKYGVSMSIVRRVAWSMNAAQKRRRAN